MEKKPNLIKFTTYILLVIASFLVLSNSASAATSCSLPDESGIVQAVASQFPQYLNNSCQESGGTWQFMDEVVERLQAKDSRWGYNGKRGNINDPSEDAISYYFGSSQSPANGDINVYIIDIIGGHCGANPSAGWLDQTQATAAAGTTGAYLYNRSSGSSAPSSGTTCSVSQPQPPPAPAPSGPPTISEVSPQTAVAGETVEIFGTNLNGATVQLKSTLGVNHDIPGATVISNTELRFEIPTEIPDGSYTVVVTNSSGTTESSQNLTIRTGGNPFGITLRLDTPNEGLPNFGQLVAIIFTWSLSVLGIVVFVMIFFAGFKWFTAAGNTAKVNEARSQITNAITGALILLAAWIILYTINPDLVGGRFVLPGLGTSTTPTGPPGGGACPDCRCADSGQGTENYSQQVEDANNSALVATGLTNAPNSDANRQSFLDAVVAKLIQAGLNATTQVLNGNDIPGSAIDLIGVWSTGDRTMERYDVLSGDAPNIGAAVQVDYTGDIPLSCTY